MVDRGLWISWYNLPDEGRDGYLSWLYGSYIPRMLEKPRFLWAAHYASSRTPPMAHIRHTTDPAVPTGNDYVLIFGAESAHAYSRGVEAYTRGAPGKLEAGLSGSDRKMLAMRIAERVAITTDEERIDGPEARPGELAPSPCTSSAATTVARAPSKTNWWPGMPTGAWTR